jgi:hypothetical protein
MRLRDLDFRLIWTLPLLVLAGDGSMAGRCWAAAGAGEAGSATIVMAADRPLYSFARQFRQRHGISVTYEEPPGDASGGGVAGAGGDAGGTAAGARRGDVAASSAGLSVTYQVSAAGGRPENPAGVIRDALAVYHAAGATVRFELLEDGAGYHILPIERRSAAGTWLKVAPVLGTRIELARETRPVSDTVLLILGKVKQATGEEIVWGYAPVNWAERTRVELGGHPQETARQLLDDALASSPWTWELLYDARLKAYVLSVEPVGPPGGGNGR